MQDLNYKIILIEGNGNYAELDSDNLDLSTVFAITDISDISSRADNITKNITLIGTKNNNRIFGNVFNHSRFVDSSIEENLFVNFSTNKKVECIVLENSVPIVKGFLVFDSADKINGNITYSCHITGNIFNFFSLLGDKQLQDLDFSDYSHTFNVHNISYSWDSQIYLSGSTVPFKLGSGYVYPFINYGDRTSPSPAQVNQIHITNFRPAIYFNTYLDKIFAQSDLSGFTYEIKGSPDFVSEINSLIIPNDDSTFNQIISGSTWVSLLQTGSTIDKTNAIVAGGTLTRVIPFATVIDSLGFLTENTTSFKSDTKNLFQWDRDVNTDIAINLNITINNTNTNPITCYIRFQERDYVDPADTTNYNSFTNFGTVSEFYIDTVAGSSTTTKIVNLVVPQRTFSQKKQDIIAFVAEGTGVDYASHFSVSISNIIVNAPSQPGNVVTYSVISGDMVKPIPPTGINQKDFIKSFTLLYNLYSYSSLFNPKHIVFESYNDYYSFARPENISSTAFDWSKKIDYSQNFKISSYGELAKGYSFTYKSDSDYYNTLYTNTYKEIYGTFSELDSLGTEDTKTVELIFSPTPVVNDANTGRNIPEIFTLDSNNLQATTSSNIRMLYYNGLKNCNGYQMGNMEVNGTTYTFTPQVDIPFPPDHQYTTYPQSSHLRLSSGLTGNTYLSDLNFGLAGQYYFPATAEIYDTPNSYLRFYDAQIKELTSLNNVIFQCEALLSENDVSNLDLKVPIFINTADGNSYYKILEVDYTNRLQTASLKFQKINL